MFERVSRLFAEGHARDVPGLMTDRQFADSDEATDAAVLIAMVDRTGVDRTGVDRTPEPTIILTRRPRSMRDHPGQVAFPGGKLEPGEDAIAAALREAEEELAIPPHAVQVVGTSDVYHTGTGFRVTPVLGILAPGIPITPDPREVDAWFEAPAALLFDRSNWTERSAMWKGRERLYLDMDYRGFRIWGVTAAIIANLSRRIAW